MQLMNHVNWQIDRSWLHEQYPSHLQYQDDDDQKRIVQEWEAKGWELGSIPS